MPKRQRKLGRGVAVVGAGMSKFGAFAGKDSRDLFVEAFTEMKGSVDRGLDTEDIDALYVGNFTSDLFEGQGHLAPIMAEWVGLLPRPATRVEDACASSGAALREGIIGIASGLYDVVLVGGVEKMTNLPTEGVTDALACASDTLYETPVGLTFPGIFANIATAHMHQYGTQVEHLMRVGIKNHENGALNPKAQMNSSVMEIMNSRIKRAKERGQPEPTWHDEMDFLQDPEANPPVAWPLRLFDCAPITDGASCLLLVSEDLAKEYTDDPIHIIGAGQGSGPPLHASETLTSLSATKYAARQAYDMAEVKPEDIKIAEVHDCFTIAEIVATEDIGFFEPGKGAFASAEGETTRDSDRPVNVSGGLKAKGHPVGATGAAQLQEVWNQLRGRANERQITHKDLELGLTHNVGGTGGTCTVHILERKQG